MPATSMSLSVGAAEAEAHAKVIGCKLTQCDRSKIFAVFKKREREGVRFNETKSFIR